MHLTLQEVSSDGEFKELVHCERIAYETPYNAVFTLFCPVIGTHETARADSLVEAENRQRQWHKNDPSSHWIKVVDDENQNKVVGAALWHIYEESPYAKPPEHEMTCYWWPEGPKRIMADQVMGQMMGPRVERMNKPHLLLEICFVEPSYRGRGAGNLLVQWGIKKADDMGIEAFVEATDDGKPLYAKHGFEYTNDFVLSATPPEQTDELLKLQQDLYFHGYFMWRPVGGKFVKGETILPWEKEA